MDYCGQPTKDTFRRKVVRQKKTIPRETESQRLERLEWEYVEYCEKAGMFDDSWMEDDEALTEDQDSILKQLIEHTNKCDHVSYMAVVDFMFVIFNEFQRKKIQKMFQKILQSTLTLRSAGNFL